MPRSSMTWFLHPQTQFYLQTQEGVMITLEMQRVENMGQPNTKVMSRCPVRELETENVATL